MRKQINAKFLNMIKDKSTYETVCIGGYGSSKSYHMCIRLLKLLKEEAGRTALVVRHTAESLKDSTYTLLVELIRELGMESEMIYINKKPMEIAFKNGSKILFKATRDVERLDSIHNVSLVYIEEAVEVTYFAYKKLRGRIRDNRFKEMLWVVCNPPPSASHWVIKEFFVSRKLSYEEFVERKEFTHDNCYYIHSTVVDNAFVSQDYKNNLARYKETDEGLYKIAFQGLIGTVGVRCFPNCDLISNDEMDEKVNMLDDYYKFIGLDFGYTTSKNALCKVAVDDEENILYIYASHESNLVSDFQLVELIKPFISEYEYVTADSQQPKTIDFLNGNGITTLKADKPAGSVAFGVRKMRRFKKIICCERTYKVYDDLTRLAFAKDKNDNLRMDKFTFDSHYKDAIVYALNKYNHINLKGDDIEEVKNEMV